MTKPQTVLQHADDSDLEAALREARAALPTPAHTARLWTQLTIQTSAAPPDAATPTGANLATTTLLSKTLGVVSAVLIAGAAAVYLVRAPSAAPMLPAPRATPLETHAPRVQHARVPAAASATRVSAAPLLPSATPRAQPMPRQMSTRKAPTVIQNRASAHASVAQPVLIDPDAELALLTRAQHALDKRPDAALAVLQEHAARFPDGVLAQEREILRIDAELALGRTVQATTRARAFLTLFPGSPHRHRFESLLRKDRVSESDHNLDREHLPTH